MINYTTTYFHCFYRYCGLLKKKRIQSFIRINVFPLLLLLTLISASENLNSQGIYIAPNTNVFIHFDTVALFSNVYNSGNLATKPGTVVSFMGSSWQNDSTATLPDEASYKAGASVPTSFNGTGGIFRFNKPKGISGTPQLLNGGYMISSAVGPTFPNLQVDNVQDIFLSGRNDTRVRNVLNFNTGKIWLNGNNFLVGNSVSPGTISGYNQFNYVVTGDGVNSGLLYRSHIDSSNNKVIFPVGADADSYTPVAIFYHGNPQNFSVRPFNQIFSNAVSGITGDSNFVQTTWNINKADNETAVTEIYIQHPKNLESSFFSHNRYNSYITRYDDARQVWDTVTASGVLSPGSLTTSTLQDSSFENFRIFDIPLKTNEFVSKSVAAMLTVFPSLSMTEYVDAVIPEKDGTFTIAFTTVMHNSGDGGLANISVANDLSNTFPSPITASVISVNATGQLYANSRFTGIGSGSDNMLLLPTSYLDIHRSDTIHLIINIDPHLLNGTFYNTVYGNAKSALTNNYIPEIISKVPVKLTALNLHIPEGFSPNGDGTNDKFVIANAIDYNIYVEMYNRWGGKVYSSNGNYNNDWDGRCNQPGALFNQTIANGTYFYIIVATNKATGISTTFKGSITLKR